MLTGNGLIVIIGGYLEEYGDKQAWSYTMIGLIMAVLTVYNYFSTPRTETKLPTNK
jgi:PAT family beta-lactamase induction signal transducer AmpG